jgi:Flp pilus assembly protein TadD
MRGRGTAAVSRAGRNDPCPCGSGRKFKQCCGAGRPESVTPEPPRDARRQPLTLGPLSEAGELREAAEGLRESMYGARIPFGDSENAAATSPQRQTGAADRFRLQGLGLLQEGKFAAAITALQRAIRLDPEDAQSHGPLGLALLRSNRLVEAAASFELAIVLEEGVVANHYYLAVALDRQGLKSRAITAYRRAVELAPELAEGHRRLGELLMAEGDVEKAAQSYRRAAACAPDTTAGRANLARALMLEGDLRGTETLLRQGIALDPDSDLLHKELGDLLSTQGHFDEAIVAYDRANDLSSSDAPAHLNAVFFRKCTEADRPRLARMLSSLRDTSLYYEYRIHLHFACGKLLDDLGEYREAMLHFEAGNRA